MMLGSTSKPRVQELWSKWTAEQALVVRHTLRDLRKELDAAVVMLTLREEIVDYVGDFDASPTTLVRFGMATVPTMMIVTTRDGERRSIASSQVRPGYGVSSFVLIASDPVPAEMPKVWDVLEPVVDDLEGHLLEACWSGR